MKEEYNILIQIEMEVVAALILGTVLLVFTLGKSPVFRLDRAGVSIVGAVAMLGLGILSIYAPERGAHCSLSQRECFIINIVLRFYHRFHRL